MSIKFIFGSLSIIENNYEMQKCDIQHQIKITAKKYNLNNYIYIIKEKL